MKLSLYQLHDVLEAAPGVNLNHCCLHAQA